MREALVVLVMAIAVGGASAGATTPDEIVPFQQVTGIRLGMTRQQATRGVGESCPTLDARTRRDRRLYSCYFTTAPNTDGTTDFIYASRSKRCGADATLLKGRVLDVSSSCPGAIENGPGIGSSFRQLYAAFRSGSVRCQKGGQFQHDCRARRATRAGVLYMEFDDGKPIDQLPPLVVASVMVGKCRWVGWSGPRNSGSINPCSRNFLVPTRFRGEIRP